MGSVWLRNAETTLCQTLISPPAHDLAQDFFQRRQEAARRLPVQLSEKSIEELGDPFRFPFVLLDGLFDHGQAACSPGRQRLLNGSALL